jgi:hypothetical protein
MIYWKVKNRTYTKFMIDSNKLIRPMSMLSVHITIDTLYICSINFEYCIFIIFILYIHYVGVPALCW